MSIQPEYRELWVQISSIAWNFFQISIICYIYISVKTYPLRRIVIIVLLVFFYVMYFLNTKFSCFTSWNDMQLHYLKKLVTFCSLAMLIYPVILQKIQWRNSKREYKCIYMDRDTTTARANYSGPSLQNGWIYITYKKLKNKKINWITLSNNMWYLYVARLLAILQFGQIDSTFQCFRIIIYRKSSEEILK